MKRWLKKHGKWVIVGIGVLFISNSIYIIVIADAEWKVIANGCVVMVWVMVTLFVSGAMNKIWNWWKKD